MRSPVIGMIVPPAAGDVPPEAHGLFPAGVRFVARGLGLGALTIEDYGIAVERVAELARALRDDGADLISLMGTSLSFFRGGAFNDELVAIIERESGCPATTMSNSIRDALRALGARRVAVGTAYSDAVNARLRGFLEASGFDIAAMTGMDLVAIDDILSVRPEAVTDLALRAAEAAEGGFDAVFVSCGGLPALHLAAEVEPRIGKPVVASSTAGVWGAVRLAGLPADAPALGALARVRDTAAASA